MLDVNWKGLILPIAYLLVLSGTFVTFSTIYRKRKAVQSANLAPWFEKHTARDLYLSLLHLDPEDASEKSEKTPKVPESVIRAALLRRAVEDIHRIVGIRAAKQACTSLLQRGSVGDDLMQRFQRAEKEMEEELRDVVTEANALAPNWGQHIFQSANEIAGNAMIRKKLDAIQAQTDAEKEWWNKRRSNISTDFMKELDGEIGVTAGTATGGSSSKAPSVSTTDEDTVLVDAETPSAPSKKKKGKK